MSSRKVTVDLRHGGRFLHLSLDAPRANILDRTMIDQLGDALREHGARPALRAIAFEGAGDHFSFGASVQEHRADEVADMLARFGGLFRQLAELSVPTFAIVRGQCLGGGMELAAFCSWIFASPSSHFGQPEIKLAVIAPLASVILPWRVGGGAAVDLCVSGRTINAEEAFQMGLAHEVIGDPAGACDRFFTEQLAPLSATSLRFAERAARLQLTRALSTDLPAIERMYLQELMATPDANEGIEAFLDEKRPPRYVA